MGAARPRSENLVKSSGLSYGRARSGRVDIHVDTQGRVRPMAGDTPRVLGCRMELFGALNRRACGQAGQAFLPFTRLEHRKSLIERDGFSHVGARKSNS